LLSWCKKQRQQRCNWNIKCMSSLMEIFIHDLSLICYMGNKTGVTSGAWTAYFSGASKVVPTLLLLSL
jgi:hypothetical protein